MSYSKLKKFKLGEIYDIYSGLSKSRGEFGRGYPFLTFKEVFNNYFIPDNLENLVNSTEKERERCSIKRGDIFLTRTSETANELGMSCVALKDYDNATFNGFTKRLRLKEGIDIEINPEYIGYYLRSPKIRNYMSSLSTMTTRASLNSSMLNNILLELPEYDIQVEIGKMLKVIDDKIELNNNVNKTLEEMAQAIFKSWFVDFEPFQDGDFEDSEIGRIPNGWRVASVYEVCNVIYGAAFKSKLFNENKIGFPLIRIRDLKTFSPQFYTDEKHPKAELVQLGDILVGMDAEFRPCIWKGKVGVLNQRVCKFAPKYDYVSEYFIYAIIKPHMEFIENFKVGTTVSHIGKNDIDKIKILIPTSDILKSFKDIIKPLFDSILKNSMENQKLINIRDTLLPKLMSGEIEVPLNEV